MMTGMEIDIAIEHEKVKANVVLLEDLIRLQKGKENEEVSVSKGKAEVVALSTKSDEARTMLEELTTKLAKEEVEHKTKATEWKEKSGKLQRILFKADISSSASSDNEENLEQSVQLAQENVTLLKQKLNIRQLSVVVRSTTQTFEALEVSLSELKITQSTLERGLEIFKSNLAAGKEKYRQNLENALKASPAVVSLVSQINRLKAEILGKLQMIKTQSAKIVELEATVKSMNDTIEAQQAIIAPLCCDMPTFTQDSAKSVETQLKEAYQKGRSSSIDQLGPLASAGRFIRTRKLEWEKNVKNQRRVELGDKASHYGMAVADATLYQDFCPNKRTDVEVFTRFYGLDPNFVWKTRKCTLLMDILDWRGSMKDFYPPQSQHRTVYQETKFSPLCHTFVTLINWKLTTWTVSSLNEYLNEGGKGYQTYVKLKALHAEGLKMHETYLKNK